MSVEILLSAQARRDVQKICEWLAEKSPQGAVRWYERFVQLIDELKQRASTFPIAAESSVIGRDLRQAIFRTRRGNRYRALFVVANDRVRIVTVRGPGQPPLEPEDVEW